jgi:hypothetical protein
MEIGSSAYFRNVTNEIRNIRKFVPKENRDKLNFKNLEPNLYTSCIYGQMFGNCFNKEAVKAIKKCCKTKTSFLNTENPTKILFVNPRFNIEGADEKYIFHYTQDLKDKNYSYLEHCIANFDKYNKDIISYLKEKTNEIPIFIK